MDPRKRLRSFRFLQKRFVRDRTVLEKCQPEYPELPPLPQACGIGEQLDDADAELLEGVAHAVLPWSRHVYRVDNGSTSFRRFDGEEGDARSGTRARSRISVMVVKHYGFAYGLGRMKNEFIGVRVSGELRRALKNECKRISKSSGVEVKESAVIRSILEQKLIPKRRSVTSERAA
jgi:hypothetical protein